ncbi:hypothetical protein HD553DRAFT_89276 [Filobasidium floriforme]|uniref:uncharacterized protein n=1 Tax=Filobasidium floriforme TaxID=5210 RepID=UPI001E8CA412|nr:uncharacterized protein HD553DRAFT_89276 [Filobasidium floriforme]KAH8081233.1 hypothetical protein HD553DRAFT_89276 [Filobasidium floriforme]
MSDAYDFRPGGSLKLKGDKDKKKKKKSYTDSERAVVKDDIERSGRAAEIKGGEGSGQAGSSSNPGLVPEGRKKTAAEEKYDKIREERRRERAKKQAKMTHKDRVAQYNAALDRLSEHHDMPRIGPG